MSKKIIPAIFVGVFLALCLSLSLGTLVFGPAAGAANEQLAEAPQLKTQEGKVNFSFLSDLESYVNDRFFLRQELITMERKLSNLMGVSGESKVIAGKDGWLFFEQTLDNYTGTNLMTNRQLFSAANNVALMEEYCRNHGKEFAFVIAPNKNSLYGKYMPSFGVTAQTSDAQRFHGLLDQLEVPYVDLFAGFNAQTEELYFAHDSHWNSKGAALGADLINQAFDVESDYFGGDFSYKVAHDGDLYAMVYPGLQDTEMNPVYGGKLNYSFKGMATQPDAIVLNTQGSGSGSLLCYRDSFGNLLFPYLADSYQSARFSRVVNYDMTQAADYVLIELVERNLCYLIQNVPVMPSPVREVELPEQVSGTVAASVDEKAGAGQDCVQLKGTLPQTPDDDSCIFVVCDGVAYEAFCLENNGFAANIPENTTAQYVACKLGGVLQLYKIQ